MNISLRDTNLFLNKPIVAMAAGALLLGGLLLGGCKKSQESTVAPASGNGLVKIRVGYIGLTCEAPIYMAVEKGFFKEEGLDPVLVKCDWSNYKDVMALGGFDITHHLVMYFLKPIEQGLDIKFTGGIHRGCLVFGGAVGRVGLLIEFGEFIDVGARGVQLIEDRLRRFGDGTVEWRLGDEIERTIERGDGHRDMEWQ